MNVFGKVIGEGSWIEAHFPMTGQPPWVRLGRVMSEDGSVLYVQFTGDMGMVHVLKENLAISSFHADLGAQGEQAKITWVPTAL